MLRIFISSCTVLTALLLTGPATAEPVGSDQSRAVQSEQLFLKAEQRFQPPTESRFFEAQAALRKEVVKVSAALDALEPKQAAGWKRHLRWKLLEANLHSMNVNLDELQLVRRWMFSNRQGTEHPLFAELRTRMDAYLDAAITFAHDDLQSTFNEKVALARRQCRAIAESPSDANAAALGRTLGWFERTGQLTKEVVEARSLLSFPNAQIVVSNSFAERLLGLFETDVDQTIPVTSTEKAPPAGILQRERTLQVTGTANSVGSTTLEVIPNAKEAQLDLIFQGQVLAHCRADAGPAAIHVKTLGPVEATKPIYLSLGGLRLGETTIDSQVNTHVEKVVAGSRFFRRIARRRADQPAARSHIQISSRQRTSSLLQENLDERVDQALAEIRAEIANAQSSMNGFSEVLAPVVREGAVPNVQGLRSTETGIELNVAAAHRNQLGALVPYSNDAVGGDVQVRVHISMANNMLETILGGKTLSDEFLMRYAKILQAQLPLPLMVHSRAKRWAITTEKHRPLELLLPKPNRIQLVMRLTAVEYDGRTYDAPATATIDYDLLKNDFDELELVRDGDVQLETTLPSDIRDVLQEKLDAFFAPLLDGGGVAVPEGGVLGALKGIEPAGFEVASDWIVVGVNVPDAVLDAVNRFRREGANDD